MADCVADTTEALSTVEPVSVESLKELVKEADAKGVVSSENLEDEDTTNNEDLDQNGSSEAKPTENGTKESTNGNGHGTSEAEAEKVEENGSADLKRKSDVGIVGEQTDVADGVLPEKKAKLDEKSDIDDIVEVSTNGESEIVV